MRSIYPIIKYICVNDDIGYSFWGLIIGIVTLIVGISLAIFLYYKTIIHTNKSINEFKDKINTNQLGIVINN